MDSSPEGGEWACSADVNAFLGKIRSCRLVTILQHHKLRLFVAARSQKHGGNFVQELCICPHTHFLVCAVLLADLPLEIAFGFPDLAEVDLASDGSPAGLCDKKSLVPTWAQRARQPTQVALRVGMYVVL